jgi:hypothetical protein
MMNLNSDKARILAENSILVPSAWYLPHGWHVSACGYVIAPIPPKGPVLDDLIECRWQMLSPAQREPPEWAPTLGLYLLLAHASMDTSYGSACLTY